MHVEAFGGDTDLAGVAKGRPEQLLGHLVDVDVRQHDAGVVAAEFQGDLLQVFNAIADDMLTDSGRARERNFLDLGMAGDGFASDLSEEAVDPGVPVAQRMQMISQAMREAVAQMPTHADFLARHCPSPLAS